ncbi:hypothetical protein [Pseudomonas donghuensis]|uniref:hypothetical protein n=1 Tax=Pseudomonas donghuensis TaxID=1163398 RepID=UPI0020C4B5FC|nr:hypothetical protein [Pseudomonas donghuensis]MCP6695846.1 hypothetical protein [Pseudomonas donghuensis]UVL26840.1 hypothetical protein LOY30_12935 [Pseudomonas donghuensis]
MSYGLQVINDSSYLQIDSDMPRLCVVHQGSYSGNSGFTVNFPQPVTSAEPPCVFIRPAMGESNVLYRSMNILGSPGAWTGFSVALSNITHTTSGTWFAAVFQATTAAMYGMRIWDSSGKAIYDTGSPAVSVSMAAHAWPYAGRVQLDIGYAYTYVCNLPKAIGPYDHFMINPFSRYLNGPHQFVSTRMGVTVDYPGNRLVMYAVGSATWIDIGSHAAVFARLRR